MEKSIKSKKKGETLHKNSQSQQTTASTNWHLKMKQAAIIATQGKATRMRRKVLLSFAQSFFVWHEARKRRTNNTDHTTPEY